MPLLCQHHPFRQERSSSWLELLISGDFVRLSLRGLAILLSIGLLAGTVCHADDGSWPRFRGPTGQGLAEHCHVGDQFDLQHGLRWRTEIPGKGWSSPVAAEGVVWITTAVTTEASPEEVAVRLANVQPGDAKEVAGIVTLRAIAVDFATGKIIHDVELGEFDDPQPINPLNSYASPTPVLADGRLFCDFGNYGTWCLDAKTGEVLWEQRIVVDYSVGPGSSPVVHSGRLILVCDGIDQQFIVGLDDETGKELWRTPRPPIDVSNIEMKKAYSTPISIDVQGQAQLVIPGAQWICGYDPLTGAELWRIRHGEGFSTSPSPVFWNGLVVFSTGFMRPELVAVRPDGTGDVTDTHIVWRAKRGAPNKPSPLVVGDHLYSLSDSGILTQLDASGAEQWQQRLGGNYSASPIATGRRLILCSHEGLVTVLQDDRAYHELARNELPEEGRLMASPAIAHGDLVIRSERALLRFGR